MYMKDLEPYRHGVPKPLEDVLAVGWLSKSSDTPKGDVSTEFVNALERLLATHRVNQMRGYHVCEFCSKSPLVHQTRSGKRIMLGSAEIWIPQPDQRLIYAAPDLIHHYVLEHAYLPPGDFIRAVSRASDLSEWNAHAECETRLNAVFQIRKGDDSS